MPASDLLIYTHTYTHSEKSVVVLLIIFNGWVMGLQVY